MTTAIISVSQHGWIAFVCYSGITSNEEVCVSILLLGPIALTRLHTQGALTPIIRGPSHRFATSVCSFKLRGDELNANSVAVHRVQPYMHSAPREKDQRPMSVGGIEDSSFASSPFRHLSERWKTTERETQGSRVVLNRYSVGRDRRKVSSGAIPANRDIFLTGYWERCRHQPQYTR